MLDKNIPNQFRAHAQIYYDKNQTLLSPFSIHALCFCNFHLMLEPLDGLLLCLYSANAPPNSSQMARVAENLHGVVGH